MIYVFYGTDVFLLQKETKKILEKHHIENISISRYDLEGQSLEDALEDASMPSMFGEKKAVLCENSSFLTSTTKKSIASVEPLEKYLQNKEEDTILIFMVQAEKLDERKKIVKEIKKSAKVIACSKEKNLYKEAQDLLEGYNIDRETLQFFLHRIGENPSFLEAEIEKLKIYRWQEKQITKEDVKALTSPYIDLNIFTFMDSIISKHKKEAMDTYEALMKQGEEPIAILIMLANQFRLMYQVKELAKAGYTEKGIAEAYKMHPYRIKMALEKSRNYSSTVLLAHLEKLRDLDYKIKMGYMDKNLALELFIIGV